VPATLLASRAVQGAHPMKLLLLDHEIVLLVHDNAKNGSVRASRRNVD
jgi:hypothetical protein